MRCAAPTGRAPSPRGPRAGVAVAHGGALGIATGLLAHDDLSDLLLHHLGQHTEPDAHRERYQAPGQRRPARRGACCTLAGSGRSILVTAWSASTSPSQSSLDLGDHSEGSQREQMAWADCRPQVLRATQALSGREPQPTTGEADRPSSRNPTAQIG